MKVTLDKQIQLQSAIIYLRFEKEIKRKDIQEYLNGKRFENSLIENRIKEYLKNIKVYDEKYQLTALGNAVKETGMLPTVEEGKYQIWFTNRDSYFGNKIFYFKRVQPSTESNGEKLNLRFDSDGHFYLPTENNLFSNLKLLPVSDYFGQSKNHQDVITMRWTWENLEKSNYIFDGQLGKGESPVKLKQTAIQCKDDLKSIIQDLIPTWDGDYKKCKVKFDELDYDDKLHFEGYINDFDWKQFKVRIEKLPLMPDSIQDAKKWRNWLVTESLRKEYLNLSDFESSVIETNDKDAFKPYLNSLDTPKPELFSNSIKKDTLAFWHLNAPLDLNPNKKTKLASKPVALKKDDKISFKNIVNKLGLDNINENSVCIYYDRFVIRDHQQRAVATLLQTIECKNKIVVTDTSPKESSSDFIQKNKPEIKLKDFKTIFKHRFPHDRYLVIGNYDEIQIWNISNSIDYITFLDKKIDVNTFGTIRQSVVFTPVSKDLLDKELLNFLETEIKNGK